MDTSETYVKMCEKAEEIQKEHFWRWDDLWLDRFNSLIKHFNMAEGIRQLEENRATNRDYYWQTLDNMVWLPRQDQLQEMVSYLGADISTRELFVAALLGNIFNSFSNKDYDSRGIVAGLVFISMEQLWLAFVMKEKYNKVWNGEDWISS